MLPEPALRTRGHGEIGRSTQFARRPSRPGFGQEVGREERVLEDDAAEIVNEENSEDQGLEIAERLTGPKRVLCGGIGREEALVAGLDLGERPGARGESAGRR